jgi:putative transposase
MDSHSVKTTGLSENRGRGIDGVGEVKGRKRHIVRDMQGHLLHVKVHAADIHDPGSGCKGFQEVLGQQPSLNGVCADAGCRKTMDAFVEKVLKQTIKISYCLALGWAVFAQRWGIARTFVWLNDVQRPSKECDISTKIGENLVMIAHSLILLKR